MIHFTIKFPPHPLEMTAGNGQIARGRFNPPSYSITLFQRQSRATEALMRKMFIILVLAVLPISLTQECFAQYRDPVLLPARQDVANIQLK